MEFTQRSRGAHGLPLLGFADWNDTLNRLLNTRSGIQLSAPGFNGFDPTKGGITPYPPGANQPGRPQGPVG